MLKLSSTKVCTSFCSRHDESK